MLGRTTRAPRRSPRAAPADRSLTDGSSPGPRRSRVASSRPCGLRAALDEDRRAGSGRARGRGGGPACSGAGARARRRRARPATRAAASREPPAGTPRATTRPRTALPPGRVRGCEDARHDLLRPRGPVPRHRRHGGPKAAAQAAFKHDPGGAPGSAPRWATCQLRAWIAERHTLSRAGAGHQRLDAGRRVPVRRARRRQRSKWWSGSRHLQPGRSCLRGRGADVERSRWRPTASTSTSCASCSRAACGRLSRGVEARPAGCALSEPKRHALLELAGEYGLAVFKDISPVLDVAIRFSGRALPTMRGHFNADGGRVVYASLCSKTVCVAASSVPRTSSPRSPGARRTPTSRPIRSPRRSCTASAWTAGRAATSATVKAALAERVGGPRRWTASCPRPPTSRRRAALSCGSELPEGTDVAALFDAAPSAGELRQGDGLPARGRGGDLRLGGHCLAAEQIDEGIARLAQAWDAGRALRSGRPVLALAQLRGDRQHGVQRAGAHAAAPQQVERQRPTGAPTGGAAVGWEGKGGPHISTDPQALADRL